MDVATTACILMVRREHNQGLKDRGLKDHPRLPMSCAGANTSEIRATRNPSVNALRIWAELLTEE